MVEAEGFGDAAGPRLGSEGLASLDAAAHRLQFFLRLRLLHGSQPMRRTGDGPRGKLGFVVAAMRVQASPEAGPLPVLGLVDEAGTQRVSFDVTAEGQEVSVALDGKGFIATLIDVALAHGLEVPLPAAGVGDGQPLHEGGQVAVGLGPEGHVPVVGHQAVGEDAHGAQGLHLGHDSLEGGVVGGLFEQGHPAHATVEHVVNIPAGGWPGSPGHGRKIPFGRKMSK